MVERFTHLKNTYFYDPMVHDEYYYDKYSFVHVIKYLCRDYGGTEYIAQWKIPGTKDKDISYARRMCEKLPAWEVVAKILPNFIEGLEVEEARI